MESLYQISQRKVGFTTFLSVLCKRGNLVVQSSEKVLPPVLEYSADGTYVSITPKQIVEGVCTHPYKPNSKEFNLERLADLEVAALYKHLEHFPTLGVTYEKNVSHIHPIAEFLYSNMVYLRPNKELAEKIKKVGYVQKTKMLPPILEQVALNLEKATGVKLDLFSVPKRKVGTYAYIAGIDGIAKTAKMFAFGMHNIIPSDRIARELSSLKSCEKFINPQHVSDSLPSEIAPYVSKIRVAIVGTEESMLDSGDLYLSALSKIACRLSRKKVEKDVAKIPREERNLVYRPFRSGIEVYHEEEKFIDETQVTPGTIRLIFPGGVKVAAQYTGKQLVDANGENVDALLAFETFAKKGAIACFLFGQDIDPETITTEKAKELFLSMKRQKVYLEEKVYEGYVVDLPVMRPGQRYTELSKASDQITVDLISKAILKSEYKVSDNHEEEYQKLKQLRSAIVSEIIQTSRNS